MEFGLVIGFIRHLQNVTTNNYDSLTKLHTPKITVTTVTSQFAMSSPVVAWWRILTVSSASVLSFLPAGDCLTTNSLFQLSTRDRSVKLLLAFASIIIFGFSLLEIHDYDFYSLLGKYVFRNGASSSTKEGSVLKVNARVQQQ
jgi:hypothetical protein